MNEDAHFEFRKSPEVKRVRLIRKEFNKLSDKIHISQAINHYGYYWAMPKCLTKNRNIICYLVPK